MLARELFVDDAQTLRASKFSSLNPTKILIHGFSQTVSAEFVVATRNGTTNWIIRNVIEDLNTAKKNPADNR